MTQCAKKDNQCPSKMQKQMRKPFHFSGNPGKQGWAFTGQSK
jgi:hypothetical protein